MKNVTAEMLAGFVLGAIAVLYVVVFARIMREADHQPASNRQHSVSFHIQEVAR